MKLTSKGRYAVMALVDLARFDNINPVSLRDISLRQGISLDYLEQIFSKLKKDQIVKSIRGTQGGYILSKKPNINNTPIYQLDMAMINPNDAGRAMIHISEFIPKISITFIQPN